MPLSHSLTVQSGPGLMAYGDVRLVEPGVWGRAVNVKGWDQTVIRQAV